MYGTAQTRDSYLTFFFVIIIYLQFLDICKYGLVSPLQGGSIETDILGHNKGGVLKRIN
jgi:hypothetical protein